MNNEKSPIPSPAPEQQGPTRSEELISPEYKDGPYPAERPDASTGEGSAVPTHSTGLTKEGLEASRNGAGVGRPVLDKKGRTKGKEEGREKNEP